MKAKYNKFTDTIIIDGKIIFLISRVSILLFLLLFNILLEVFTKSIKEEITIRGVRKEGSILILTVADYMLL